MRKFRIVFGMVFFVFSLNSLADCGPDEFASTIRSIEGVFKSCRDAGTTQDCGSLTPPVLAAYIGVPEITGVAGNGRDVAITCRRVFCDSITYPFSDILYKTAALRDVNCLGNVAKTPDTPGSTNVCASIIKPVTQVLGESIPIVGVPFELKYYTSRISGRAAENKVKIFVNGNAGDILLTNIPGQPNLSYTGTSFNIKDRNGTTLYSNFYTSSIPKFYEYEWVNPSGLGAKVIVHTRSFLYNYQNETKNYNFTGEAIVGSFRAESLGLGGWYPSIWHYYDVNTRELFLPDGNRYKVEARTMTNGELQLASSDGSGVYEFDSEGRHLRTRSFLLGSVLVTFEYTSSKKLYRVVERNGRSTVFNRDSGDKLVSITSASGKTSYVSLTTDGYLSQVTDPSGKSYSMTYYGNKGLLATYTKPTSETNTFTYDSDGNLTKDEHSGGVWYTLAESAMAPDVITKIIASREGKQTTYDTKPVMDNIVNNGVITTQSGLNYSDSYSNVNGEEVWSQKGIDYTKSSELDVSRFPSQVSWPSYTTDNSSGTVRAHEYVNFFTSYSAMDPWTYTSWQHDDRLSLASGGVALTRTMFTTGDRNIVTTTPLANTFTTVLDTEERPISFTKGTLNPVTFTYEMDQIKTIQLTSARTTTLNYDPTSRLLISIVNPLSQTVSFGYDSNERLISQTLPDASVITYTYDDSGRVIGITPPSRPIHTLGIDSKELFGSYIAPTQTTSLQYNYDYDKRPTLVTRPSGRTISYNYNPTAFDLSSIVTSSGTTTIARTTPYRRISSVAAPSGAVTGFDYSGNYISKESFSHGSVTAYTEKYFLAEGKMSGMDMKIGTATVSNIPFTYNSDEQLITAGGLNLEYSAAPNGILNKTTIGILQENITTNSFAEITSRNVKNGSTTLFSETLTRDNLGRIETRSYTVNGWSAKSYKYVYDNRGRLSEVQDLSSVWIRKFLYDANGNRTSLQIASPASSTTLTYDSQDRLSTFGSNTYAYNTDGELQSRTNTVLNQTANFVYDTLGNLTQVTLENGTVITYEVDGLNRRISKAVNGTVTKRYLWEQNRLVAELNANGTLKRRYVYATKSHAPDYYIEAGVNYKIVTDTLGSPVMVIRASNGSIIQRIEYDEFGKVIQDNLSGALAIGYAGGLSDWDTKLVRFGARDYDPTIGRWTSKDPIGFAGGDTNLYSYVGQDPMSYIDPMGLAKCSYSITSGKLNCTSNDGKTSYSSQMFSGVGDFKNKPNATGSFGGPIPIGSYDIKKISGGKVGDWFLDPGLISRIGYKYGQNRGGFLLHLRKGDSNGCITGDPNASQSDLDNINSLLGAEDGNNSIDVGL